MSAVLLIFEYILAYFPFVKFLSFLNVNVWIGLKFKLVPYKASNDENISDNEKYFHLMNYPST